jgi:hypothetical protein
VTITYAHSELPTTAGRKVAADVTLPGHDRPPIALEAVMPNLPEALILDDPFGNRSHHTTSRRSGQPSEGPAIHHLFFTSAYFVVGRRIWYGRLGGAGRRSATALFRRTFADTSPVSDLSPRSVRRLTRRAAAARGSCREPSASVLPLRMWPRSRRWRRPKSLSYTALLRIWIKEAGSIGSET